MSEIREGSGSRSQQPGRAIHSGYRGDGPGRAAWQRLRGALAGALLIAFSIPSAGCIGSMMCSEGCYGEISCARFAANDCGQHPGCALNLQGACTGHESCAVYDDASACKADNACTWEKNCC